MLPNEILPETIVRESGSGPALDVSASSGDLLVVTLELTRVIEDQSIAVGIYGSSDGEDWTFQPLAQIPPKSYCGYYSTLVNLSGCPWVQYIRAEWSVTRPKRATGLPLFGVRLFAEASGARMRKGASSEEGQTAARSYQAVA